MFEGINKFPPSTATTWATRPHFCCHWRLGLLIAARALARYRLAIAIGAVASVIHTFNHAYDAVFEGMTHGHWLLDFTPLVLLAAALIVAYYRPEAR